MTPRNPIDISDMAIGTHNWAESIRWASFWFKWKLGQQQDKAGFEDLTKDDLDEFERTPWYKRTDRSAPLADQDTENFISECQIQFLDPKNRRRIKGNFTKGQWESARKLRNLPLTHNAGLRFADKSSKTIITNLDNDDELILSDINDAKFYDCVTVDPTVRIKERIYNFAVKWFDENVLDENQFAFITDISDTVPGKIKPLIKTHKPEPWPIRVLLSGSNTPVQPLSKFVQYNIKHLPSYLPHQILDTKEFYRK